MAGAPSGHPLKNNRAGKKTSRQEENRGHGEDRGYSSDYERESKGSDDFSTQERTAQRRRCVSPGAQVKALTALPYMEALPAPAVAVREVSVSALAFAVAPAPAHGGARRENGRGLFVDVHSPFRRLPPLPVPPPPSAFPRGSGGAFAFADMVHALGDIDSASPSPSPFRELPDTQDIDSILREIGCLDEGTGGLFTFG